jgi:flagellar biosynthetic protein FliO
MMTTFQVIGALIAVIGLMLGCVHLAKKYLPAMGVPRNLSVSEQLHLGDRCRILVVKVRGQELLVGVTRESISILDKLPQ